MSITTIGDGIWYSSGKRYWAGAGIAKLRPHLGYVDIFTLKPKKSWTLEVASAGYDENFGIDHIAGSHNDRNEIYGIGFTRVTNTFARDFRPFVYSPVFPFPVTSDPPKILLIVGRDHYANGGTFKQPWSVNPSCRDWTVFVFSETVDNVFYVDMLTFFDDSSVDKIVIARRIWVEAEAISHFPTSKYSGTTRSTEMIWISGYRDGLGCTGSTETKSVNPTVERL